MKNSVLTINPRHARLPPLIAIQHRRGGTAMESDTMKTKPELSAAITIAQSKLIACKAGSPEREAAFQTLCSLQRELGQAELVELSLRWWKFVAVVDGQKEPFVDYYYGQTLDEAKACHDEDMHRYGLPVEKTTLTITEVTDPATLKALRDA